jgi:photosystem II stability/assembly factor-like uncharacterized protein
MITRITLSLDRALVRTLGRPANAEHVNVEFVTRELKGAIRRSASARFAHSAMTSLQTKMSVSGSIIAAVVLCATFGSAMQRQSAGGPPGGNLYHVAVSRRGSSTLFASALAGGVFRSVDAGASWQEVDRGLPDDAFCEMVIDPRATRVVYAVCGETVFKTADNGGRWTRLTLPATSSSELVIAPSDSKILYLPGNRSSQLLVSRTAGREWTTVTGRGLPDERLGAIAVDTLDAAILYGVCGRRLFKSTDSGVIWTAVTKDLPADEEIGTVRGDYRRPGVVYAGAGQKLFKSTSAGASWRAIGEFPAMIDDVLTGSAVSADVIVVRANAGLFRSDDGGIRWTPIGNDLKHTVIWNVVMDPASDATLYAATFAGLFVTTDAGGHWRQVASLGLLRSVVWAMSADAGNPTTVHVLTESGTFTSADGGNTWRPATGIAQSITAIDDRWKDSRPNGQTPQRLTVVPGDPLRAFASVGAIFKPKSLWRTVDGGATWQHADDCSSLSTTYACHVIVDPNDSRVIYEITVGESPEAGWETVRRSVDGGDSWHPLKSPASIWLFAVLPTRPATTTFADLPISSGGSSHTLMMSTDRGEHWVRSDRGLPPLKRVTALVMDPSRPSRLYAGTDGRGVFVSVDGGRQWTPTGAVVAH